MPHGRTRWTWEHGGGDAGGTGGRPDQHGQRRIGISPPKRHVFVDSFPFEEPNYREKPKKPKKPRRVTKATRKTTAPPARKPKARIEPTPEQVEAQKQATRERDRKRPQTLERKEANRLGAKARRQEAVRLGTCRSGADQMWRLRRDPSGEPAAVAEPAQATEASSPGTDHVPLTRSRTQDL